MQLYLILIITFVSVVGLCIGCYYLWAVLHESTSAKVQRRLRLLSAGGGHGEELMQQKHFSDIPIINQILIAIPRLHMIDQLLVESNLNLTVARFIAIQLICSGVIALAVHMLILLPWVIALPTGIMVGFSLPYMLISRQAEKRRRQFVIMLPDALDFIARSMRAGNPFTATLKIVAEEMGDPIGAEFKTTFEEINYGLQLEDALYNLGGRIQSDEVQYFIAAVLIQKVTGGNLADVLHRIASVMRARVKTYREVDILAAEMRISANVLIGLPFFVAGAILVGNPDYFEPLLTSEFGYVIIMSQFTLMVLGYFVIQRMIHFRV
ncbi:MAG: type II secretion system F family protein [Mariprofundus sp.]